MIADMPSQSSRVDPERQQHIIDAALRVIASRGVAGTSHRVVAAEAHVPLGSMTYYFDGMHDLLHQAFDQFARASVLKFAARMQSASTVDEACDASFMDPHSTIFTMYFSCSSVISSIYKADHGRNH